MKQFHELTTLQQTKAKEHAIGEIVDQIMLGILVPVFSQEAMKVLEDAQVLEQLGKHDMAKAYLMQSKVFTKSLNEFVEAAVDAAMFIET